MGSCTRTIVVVGGLARRYITEADEVPDPGETIETTKPFSSHTGGRGAFTAVAAHRLSHVKPSSDESHIGEQSAFPNMKIKVHLVATVGEDDAGDGLKKRMTECGVNADHVQKIQGASSIIFVVVDKNTKDHRIWFDPTANHKLEPDVFRERNSLNNFAGGEKPALLVTTLELKKETTMQLIETAGKDGVEVLLNLVPSQIYATLPNILNKVTHLVIHKAEARRLRGDCPADEDDPKGWGRIAQRYIHQGAKNVVITLSFQGAYFANKFGDADVVRREKPENISDKVGGGETFIGAYAAEYVRQKATGKCDKQGRWDIKAAVQRGCKAANCSLSHEGCIYPLPWANEIDE